MKLNRIQITNLASISHADIDFSRPPLLDTGLFAITGDTGAGKSTVLDALCLALFGKTARLKNDLKLTVDLNGDDIKLNDPRHLLRRGTAVAQCEVDFVGNDGTYYRAVWRVARARGKVDGRLQVATHQLFDASDELIAEKSHTAKQIEHVLGLSFEQFTRAVLLAQHEFSAFLKATADERAQLLETLTGSDKFSRLGQLIFERHKAKKQELEFERHRLGDFTLLTSEQLTELESQQLHIEQEIGLLKEKLESLVGAKSWYQRSAELTQKIEEKQAQLAEVSANLANSQHEFDFAKCSLAAQEISDNRINFRKLSQQKLSLEKDIAELNKIDFRSQDTQFQKALAELNEVFRLSTAELNDAKRIASNVAKLDIERTKYQAQWTQLQDATGHLTTESQTTNKLIEQTLEYLAQLQADLECSKLRIDESESLQLVIPQFAEISRTLHELANVRERISHFTSRINTLGNEREALAQTLQTHRQNMSGLSQDWQNKAEQVAELSQRLSQSDGQVLASRKADFERLLELERQQETAMTRLLQLDSEKKRHTIQLNTLEQQLIDTQQQLTVSTQLTMKAKENLHQVQFRSSERVSQLRAQLVKDEECMVCGSTHHPYAVDAIDEHWLNLLADFENQVSKAEQAQSQCQERYQLQLAQKEQLVTRIHLLSQQNQQAQQQSAELRNQSEYLVTALGLDFPLDIDKLKGMAESARQTLSQYHEDIKLQSILASEEKALHDQLLKAQTAVSELSQKITNIENLELSIDEQMAQLIESANNSNASLAPWVMVLGSFGSIDENPLHVLKALESAIRELQKEQNKVASLQGEIALCSQQHLNASAQREKLVEQINQNTFKSTELERQLSMLNSQRNALIPLDLSSEDWLKERELQWANAQQSLLDKQQAFTAFIKNKDEHAMLLKHKMAVMDEMALELSANGQRFETWFVRFSEQYKVDEPTLDELLALDSQARNQLLEMSQKLNEEKNSLQLSMSQLNEQVAELELRKPDISNEEIEAQHNALSEQYDAFRTKQVELSSELKLHFINVEKLGAQQEKLESLQRDYEHFAILDRLLGDATGKKMRNLAQVNSLKLLLQYANQHLGSLTKRYRIIAIGQSLEIAIIDKDMADEQRAITTLSGGESFLVSLSLALGLASMSSNKVKISSLFIDEGFGTLDPETLSIALDALDALQAQGRKVGVISHVAQMSERIGTQVRIKKGAGGHSTVSVIQQ
ncbi:hypothetical protein PALB_14110 [Pseudoalteromonas luteoviolacea B = ATCC 29581]|nr:hypothetical protein PALB_14110 [Pseudoalteromonas luteoviolacea B = ATCC 29581]